MSFLTNKSFSIFLKTVFPSSDSYSNVCPELWNIINVLVKLAYWIKSNIAIAIFNLTLLLPIWLSLFQFCDSKVVALNPFASIFCISFVDWFMTSFLYCFPYSYCSSNYCDSNSCRSFTLLKALAKSKSTHIAIAFKSEKEQ